MDADISRASIPEQNDPHDWNSWDHYINIHEQRIGAHPFIDHTKPHTLTFTYYEDEDILELSGRVYCYRDVIVEVEKLYETRYFGNILKIRGYSYLYVAWVRNGHPVVRYHNVHFYDDDYHHRAFNVLTGEPLFHETLRRYQFPTLTDVLDEVELLTRCLDL